MGYSHIPGTAAVKFRLPEALAEQLKARALENGKSQAQYLRDLVSAHLDPESAVDEAMVEAASEADAIVKIRRELHRRLDDDPGSIKDSLFGRLAEWALDEERAPHGSDLEQLLAAIGESPNGGKLEEIADILRGSSLPDERRLELAETGLVAYEQSEQRLRQAAVDLNAYRDEVREKAA